MNAPARQSTKLDHLPALDGLRGLAVIGVLAFHGGFAAFQGGFLGVSIFFTLSGFLITSLLLREFAVTGTISLRVFWSRRFRRLMPAALVGLLVACLYGLWFASPEQLATLRTDVLASLGYVANWRFVLEHKRYADLFAAPSPVQHFWSLAIEEQFYVVYPLLVAGVLRVGGRRGLVMVLAALGAASVTLSFALSSDFDRVYYGTDTRAFELLAGGLFALWWSTRGATAPARLPRAVREVAGVGALVGSLVAWKLVGQTSLRLPRGGFALQATATVVLLVAATSRTTVAQVLSWAPLRAVGLVSYGLYLYHWPVFLTLDEKRLDLSRAPLFGLRVVVTVAIALVSYYALERPIRRGRVLRAGAVRFAAPVAVLALIGLCVAVTYDPPPSTVAYANARLGDLAPRVVEFEPSAPSTTGPALPPSTVTPTGATGATASSGATGATVPSPIPNPGTVMTLGDSGMVDLQPALGAAYAATGVRRMVYAAGLGFGLSRPGFDWQHVWGDLIEAQRPDVVVMMLGGWDIPFLERSGPDAYAALVEEAIALITSKGARVVWMAMLPGGSRPDRPVDPTFQKVAARHPGVVDYFDPESVLRTGDGMVYARVRDEAGTKFLLRKPDVWHLCASGAERVAASVVDHTGAIGWTAPGTRGWEQGAWRADVAYKDPVGGCDPRSAGADQ